MSISVERAIEILDPEHREHYELLPDGMEQVNEACRMGMEALRAQKRGRWHDYYLVPGGGCVAVCSVCENKNCFVTQFAAEYCHHCGARMEGP